jgi:Tfp pilus assembly protein PilP
MRVRVSFLLAAAAAFASFPALAQLPSPAPVEKPAQTTQKPEPPPPPAFTYETAGRRDPFVSLIGRGTVVDPSGVRPPGLAGMLINEVSLKGIMKERTGFVAFVQGPDKKTYTIRQGQRLLDGSVKSISQDTIVFSQDVNDPLSLVKEKEVRKKLRSGEENRG